MANPRNTTQRGAVPRRATNASIAAAQAAKRIVADVQQKMAGWHHRTATLRALIQRGRDEERSKSEAAQLAALVLAARVELEHDLDAGDVTIARHSMIRDIKRSLT